MKLNSLNNVSFGLKVQQNPYNRSKEQEAFTKTCLYSQDVVSLDKMATSYTDSGIYIRENEDGSASLSLTCNNFWGDPVLSHKSDFDLKNSSKKDIKNQIKDFLKNAEECIKCVMAHPTLGKKKMAVLYDIQKEANEIEKTYKDAHIL